VVHPIGGRKQDGIVAVLAHVTGQYVIEIFANCVGAIVTTETITREISVIEVCWQPGHRCMTVIAIVAACYVAQVLAGRDGTVMA
jgi:hypothetical protein